MKNQFRTLLKAEEAFLFAVSIYFFYLLKFSWWWLLGGLFLPDIGMLGYLVNTKIGAFTYNIFHNRIIGIVCFAIGTYFNLPYLKLAGIILFAHVAMDRTLNFGLKYSDSFRHTHLGNINV